MKQSTPLFDLAAAGTKDACKGLVVLCVPRVRARHARVNHATGTQANFNKRAYDWAERRVL
jgi:hypothetical protein